MLGNQNFGPVRQGDSFRINFALENADGTPLLLAEAGSAVTTWRWSANNGGLALGEVTAELIDGGDGEAVAQVLVPTGDVGFFYHELEMILSGDTSTMAAGTFSIEREIVDA